MKQIAIIGRPNVGKSSIFNRLVGKDLSLVYNYPGTTRDRKYGASQRNKISFIDTSGIYMPRRSVLNAEASRFITKRMLRDKVNLADEDDTKGRGHIQRLDVSEILAKSMLEGTKKAISEAEIILFVVSGKDILHSDDYYCASLLRQTDKPVILVVNKCDNKKIELEAQAFYELGFAEVIFVSSLHNVGIEKLNRLLAEYNQKDSNEPQQDKEVEESDEKSPIKMVIFGQPNVGKSTLINALLKRKQQMVDPIPGTTIDSVSFQLDYRGQDYIIVDTAGAGKKTTHKIEQVAIGETLRSVKYANVVVLMLDASRPLEVQDIRLMAKSLEEYRAVIIVGNKFDLVKEKRQVLRYFQQYISTSIKGAANIPIVPLSALHSRGINKLMEAAKIVYEAWNKKIPASKLNTWLEQVQANHPHPLGSYGQNIRFKFIAQKGIRPPSFVLFTNHPAEVKESYLTYLRNNLHRDFELYGVASKILLKKSSNPYENKEDKIEPKSKEAKSLRKKQAKKDIRTKELRKRISEKR